MQRVIIPDTEIPAADPEQLIYCFSPWVQKVANRYRNAIEKTGAAIDMDDLLQVGRLALIRAQRKYDPSGGASFLTFSFQYLRGSMWREIEKNKPSLPPGAFVSLDEPTVDDSPLSEIVEDKTIEPAEERAERMERAEELHRAVDRIKYENRRTIINKLYFQDGDITSIAEEMGISKQYASALHKDALSRLRRDEALRALCAPAFSVGAVRFRRRWESCVEAEILWKEKMFDERFGSGAYVAHGRLADLPGCLTSYNAYKRKRQAKRNQQYLD